MDLLDQLSELPTTATTATTATTDLAVGLDTVLARARETGAPTALTENGAPVAVVMSWDIFELLEAAAAGLRSAEHRLQGCRFGPVKPPEGVDCGCRTAEEFAAELDGEPASAWR
ncbi:type II toxin-antitoxin system prevent-host-death family antitoxin, partial [Streptomyces sp. NPDC057638]|uniref:type II toxin-antitoxin system prevent-host-death family antitoxin n=1 Tax=Streptomyces sp. NPDC057638 TaxID=3346190 RepID=UPI0036AA787C